MDATAKPRHRTPVKPVTPPPPRRPGFRPPEPVGRTGLHAAVDRVAAAGLLLAAAPVIALAAALVRLTSAGPAFYTQQRLGRGGRPFTIVKLRTMCDDAEGLTGPRWSLPGDPRITPVGNVLRALHIDELPQLWNVLAGDMALVGPRPERPEIADGLRKLIRRYDDRLAVLPGITGLAQIHLPPDESTDSVRTKLVHDRLYIRRMSLPFDLYIVACTGLKVIGLRRLYARKK